jgi:hypothetical protein
MAPLSYGRGAGGEVAHAASESVRIQYDPQTLLRPIGKSGLGQSGGFSCAETPFHRLHLANRAQVIDRFAAMPTDIGLNTHLGDIAASLDQFITLYTLHRAFKATMWTAVRCGKMRRIEGAQHVC